MFNQVNWKKGLTSPSFASLNKVNLISYHSAPILQLNFTFVFIFHSLLALLRQCSRGFHSRLLRRVHLSDAKRRLIREQVFPCSVHTSQGQRLQLPSSPLVNVLLTLYSINTRLFLASLGQYKFKIFKINRIKDWWIFADIHQRQFEKYLSRCFGI